MASVTGPQWPADTLSTVVIALSLVLALAAAVLAVLDKKLPNWLVAGLVLLELLLIALAIVTVVAWATGTTPTEPAVYAAYLMAVLLTPPAAWWWARNEPSRWGPAAIALLMLMLPVLVVRLTQVWTGNA